MNKFDAEEEDILEAFEKGVLKRSENAVEEIRQHKIVAEAVFKKDARINIRLAF
jgi:predicted DNA binding CopG/RHH family protein